MPARSARAINPPSAHARRRVPACDAHTRLDDAAVAARRDRSAAAQPTTSSSTSATTRSVCADSSRPTTAPRTRTTRAPSGCRQIDRLPANRSPGGRSVTGGARSFDLPSSQVELRGMGRNRTVSSFSRFSRSGPDQLSSKTPPLVRNSWSASGASSASSSGPAPAGSRRVPLRGRSLPARRRQAHRSRRGRPSASPRTRYGSPRRPGGTRPSPSATQYRDADAPSGCATVHGLTGAS